MFGRKVKKKKTYIHIYFNGDNRSTKYERGEIPIKEEIIIQKSILFFNDPEPCYIHRGAVIVRLNEEIMGALEPLAEKEIIEKREIPEEIIRYIDLEGIKYFNICDR